MQKLIISIVFLTIYFQYFCGGQLRNVRFLNHVDYIVDVVQATTAELESNGWSNLKLPDTEQIINETIFGWEALGKITFTNGFLVSIERVDIVQYTVQQVWSQNGSVDFRARVRMHDVVVGFDALVNLTVANRHYTGTYRHPMVNFEVSIVKDMNQNTITTSVLGNTPTSNNLVNFMPNDNITDVLTTLYVRESTMPGVNAWGPEVMNPILDDIVRNKVEFPTICYNCPG